MTSPPALSPTSLSRLASLLRAGVVTSCNSATARIAGCVRGNAIRMDNNEVRLETAENGVGVLTVDRPASLNALNWEAIDLFHQRVREARDDKRIRALVVTGAGTRAFISGGDLSELKNYPTEADGRRLSARMSEALADLDGLEIPVIAAINGHSRGGGCEVAVSCDIRIIADIGSMGFVHVRQGITTAWGGAARLKRLVGYGRAMELLLTGRVLTPGEAHAVGLVEQIVPQAEVLATARSVAEQIAANPPQAVRALKRLVRLEVGEMFAHERDVFARLWETGDHLEAVMAFLEKRQPVFNFGGEG